MSLLYSLFGSDPFERIRKFTEPFARMMVGNQITKSTPVDLKGITYFDPTFNVFTQEITENIISRLSLPDIYNLVIAKSKTDVYVNKFAKSFLEYIDKYGLESWRSTACTLEIKKLKPFMDTYNIDKNILNTDVPMESNRNEWKEQRSETTANYVTILAHSTSISPRDHFPHLSWCTNPIEFKLQLHGSIRSEKYNSHFDYYNTYPNPLKYFRSFSLYMQRNIEITRSFFDLLQSHHVFKQETLLNTLFGEDLETNLDKIKFHTFSQLRIDSNWCTYREKEKEPFEFAPPHQVNCKTNPDDGEYDLVFEFELMANKKTVEIKILNDDNIDLVFTLIKLSFIGCIMQTYAAHLKSGVMRLSELVVDPYTLNLPAIFGSWSDILRTRKGYNFGKIRLTYALQTTDVQVRDLPSLIQQ